MVRQLPDVGNELRIGHEAEVDRVAIAEHRDVEARAFHDRAHRVGGDEFGAGQIERERRAGNVRDNHVVNRAVMICERERRVQAGRQCERPRCRVLAPVREHPGADGVVLRLCTGRGLRDRVNALERIVDVGRQRREQGRDLVAHRPDLLLGADRDGAHSKQRAVGALVVSLEILPKRAGADRQHDIVHLDVERLADRLDLAQRNPRERHRSLRGDRPVPRSARRGERQRADCSLGVAPVADHVGDALDGSANQRHHVAPASQLRCQGVTHEFEVTRDALGLCGFRCWSRGRARLQVVELGHDLGAGRPIDGGVVDLGDEADPALFHPFDDPDLPQRPRAIERDRSDLTCDRRQLSPAPRLRHANPTNVIVGIEVRVLDPHGVVELERHLGKPSGECGDPMKAADDVVPERLERVAVGHRRRVVDAGHRYVHVGARRFEVQEGGIQTGQSLHVIPTRLVGASLSRIRHVAAPEGGCAAPGARPHGSEER